MAIEPPVPGAVVDYPYLWARERDAGEIEGRKSRPVCVVASLATADGEHLIALLAITSQPPRDTVSAIEIPALERRRAGLAGDSRAWVIVDEFNTDVLERSWYFVPNARRGALGPVFLARVLEAFRAALTRRGAMIDRQA